MSDYKNQLTLAMDKLAAREETIFVGYGLRKGRANGTLVNVPESKLFETPVAENLMVGMAIGLSLRGRLPVVYLERFDFVMNAMDAIVNHLDKLQTLSSGRYCPGVILRIVVGGMERPLFTGPTHVQDFTTPLNFMVAFPVVNLLVAPSIAFHYAQADRIARTGTSTALVEYRDRF
jgi:pyruvate/2-oxoglutarate/acetoin dehydrogenase E1 component